LRAGARIQLGLTAAVALVWLAAPGGASGDDTASKRERCFQGSSDNFSASYVYKISARNLGCDRAKKLVKEYHQCRHQNGGWNGKCARFSGFSCSQTKLDSSPQLLQAKGKCVKGSHQFVNVFGELRR
jgi:hypothetical protein